MDWFVVNGQRYWSGEGRESSEYTEPPQFCKCLEKTQKCVGAQEENGGNSAVPQVFSLLKVPGWDED